MGIHGPFRHYTYSSEAWCTRQSGKLVGSTCTFRFFRSQAKPNGAAKRKRDSVYQLSRSSTFVPSLILCSSAISSSRCVLLDEWARDPGAQEWSGSNQRTITEQKSQGTVSPNRLLRRIPMNSRLTRVLVGFVAVFPLLFWGCGSGSNYGSSNGSSGTQTGQLSM